MTRRLGLVAALLALFGQLLLSTTMPQPAAGASLADLLGDPGAICHADGSTSDGSRGPAHPGHSGADCPLCPVCATLIHAVPLPVAPPSVPPRRAAVILRATPPVVALLAPPTPRLAAEPRGPPARS